MPVLSTSGFSLASEALDLVRSLLADKDQLPAVPITTASRTSNIVTITTGSVHGLVVGDIVQLVGITDTSFNGTHEVAEVPTTTTFKFAQTASNGSSSNGTAEKVHQGDVYTDTVLLPFLNAAYRQIQRKLIANGSKTMISEATFTAVAAGLTELTEASTPSLPEDFLAPRELQERVTGTGKYIPMNGPVDMLPDAAQTTYNRVWSWREDGLFFVGATSSLDIRLRYDKSLPRLSGPDSVILIRGGLDAVAYLCAALASSSRGSTQASSLASLSTDALNDFLNSQAKSRQYSPVRRRGYGRSNRRSPN